MLIITVYGNINIFSQSKKVAKIKKIFSKNIEFHNESEIEKKIGKLRKNNIWLDNLSCSIHYKNLLKKRNKIIEKIHQIYFFKSIKNSTEI